MPRETWGREAKRIVLRVLVVTAIVALAVGVTAPVLGVTPDAPSSSPQAGIIDGDSNALEDVAHTTVRGDELNQSVGTAVSAVGDVDGDETADMAVGGPGPTEQNDSEREGSVSLFFGPLEEGSVSASDDADVVITGDAGAQTGLAVTAADITDDGQDDLIVGAPMAGDDHTGQVGIFYGDSLESGMELTMADANVTLEGEEAGARFGQSIAIPTGLLEDDDVAVAVGQPGMDSQAGGVAVYRAATVTNSPDEPDATLTGANASDRAGWSLAAVPNESDGTIADGLLVGAPYNDSAGDDAGAAYLVRSLDDGAERSLESVETSLTGEAAHDRAGWAVDATGNLSEDGSLLVGAPYSNATELHAGLVHVVDAEQIDNGAPVDLANAATTIRGEAAGEHAGWAVAGTPCVVTCNGADDIAVGAPGFEDDMGQVAIVAGETIGDIEEMGLSSAHTVLVGDEPNDTAGAAVGGGEDLTESSANDLLVGAPGHDDAAGTAYVVEGDLKQPGEVTEPRPPAERPAAPTPAPDPAQPTERENFTVNITNITDPVSVTETVNVTANVTNVGEANGTQNITLGIDNETVDIEENLSLEPNESEEVTVQWTADEPGNYTATVSSENDSDSRPFEVTPPDPAFFEVEITAMNETIQAGEPLAVTATVTNTGEQADTQDIELAIDDASITSDELDLEPGDNETVILEWEGGEPGNYTATVSSENDNDSQQFVVENETDIDDGNVTNGMDGPPGDDGNATNGMDGPPGDDGNATNGMNGPPGDDGNATNGMDGPPGDDGNATNGMDGPPGDDGNATDRMNGPPGTDGGNATDSNDPSPPVETGNGQATTT